MIVFIDIFKSLKSSIRRNGPLTTLNVLLQYIKLKTKGDKVHTFFFRPFKSQVILRSGSSDFSVFRQVAMNGEYDIDFVIDPKVIIDVGANIGLASLYFHKRFPQARIYALEPDPKNYSALRQQVGGISLIQPFQYALWGEPKELKLLASGVDAWGIRVCEATEQDVSNVRGIDLASFMKSNNIAIIDLLKIDIEGAEVEVFQSSYAYWLQRTRVLIIELHETLRPGAEEIFYKALQSIRHTVSRSGENLVVVNLDIT